MTELKPNLFEWATSELSQDAVLCWLAAWADPCAAGSDRSLHRLGMNFLKLIFVKHGREVPNPITSIEIRRQHRNIDVLIVINHTIVACIEDKVGTTEHSDQLRRYLVSLEKDGFARDCLLPAYIQIGEQGDYRQVRDAGYVVIRRPEIINLLRDYLGEGGSDSIVRDFHAYLMELDTKIEAFRLRPLEEWDGYAWQGFYTVLQETLGEGEWGYVPNQSGGFMGYWWHSHSDRDSEQYLQIQEGNLCFKISVEEPSKRSELRSTWNQKILAAAVRENLNVVRPLRFGSGTSMTVAMLDGDFAFANNAGSLELEATIGVLRKATNVLNRAVEAGAGEFAAAQGR